MSIRLTQSPCDIQEFPVIAETILSIGDLVYLDVDDAKPASALVAQSSNEDTQRAFANRFLGISQAPSTEGLAQSLPVTTDFICEATCTSATFQIGDLVAVAWDEEGVPISSKVVKTTDPSTAIGFSIETTSGETSTIKVRLVARWNAQWSFSPGGGVGKGCLWCAPWGEDALGTGSVSRPFRTITTALTKATENETIILFPGLYAEEVYVTKPVSIIGFNEIGCFISKIVDGGPVFHIQSPTGGNFFKNFGVVNTSLEADPIAIQIEDPSDATDGPILFDRVFGKHLGGEGGIGLFTNTSASVNLQVVATQCAFQNVSLTNTGSGSGHQIFSFVGCYCHDFICAVSASGEGSNVTVTGGICASMTRTAGMVNLNGPFLAETPVSFTGIQGSFLDSSCQTQFHTAGSGAGPALTLNQHTSGAPVLDLEGDSSTIVASSATAGAKTHAVKITVNGSTVGYVWVYSTSGA